MPNSATALPAGASPATPPPPALGCIEHRASPGPTSHECPKSIVNSKSTVLRVMLDVTDESSRHHCQTSWRASDDCLSSTSLISDCLASIEQMRVPMSLLASLTAAIW